MVQLSSTVHKYMVQFNKKRTGLLALAGAVIGAGIGAFTGNKKDAPKAEQPKEETTTKEE
jgi:hypothetical protein